MKRVFRMTMCSFLLLFAANLFAADGKTYGKKITLKDTTKISTILAQPEKFLGKKVLVQGTVLDVCKMRGCWMEIAGDKPFQKIRVKVNDGEIIFPLSAKGKRALAEGEVYKIELSKENAIKYLQHQAEERGEKFNPESVKGPLTIYQLKGLGAVIR